MGSATVVSELSFPGYWDAVTTKLPESLRETSSDQLKAQADNVLRLIDGLAYRYLALARRLGYLTDKDFDEAIDTGRQEKEA